MSLTTIRVGYWSHPRRNTPIEIPTSIEQKPKALYIRFLRLHRPCSLRLTLLHRPQSKQNQARPQNEIRTCSLCNSLPIIDRSLSAFSTTKLSALHVRLTLSRSFISHTLHILICLTAFYLYLVSSSSSSSTHIFQLSKSLSKKEFVLTTMFDFASRRRKESDHERRRSHC